MVHQTFITARFGETDAFGHVNNVSYFIYMEQARVEFLKSLGYTVGDGGINFVLVSTKCDYISQAYFDQKLTIETVVTKIGQKSFQLDHIISDGLSHKVIAKGISVVVILGKNKDKALPIDEVLKDKLNLHLEMVSNEVNS